MSNPTRPNNTSPLNTLATMTPEFNAPLCPMIIGRVVSGSLGMI